MKEATKQKIESILTDELNLLSGWLSEFKKDDTTEKVEKADTKKALDKNGSVQI